MKRLFIILLSFIATLSSFANDVSVAGLIPVDNCGRKVWNFNAQWRFHLGDVKGAEKKDYDDSSWDVVSTPHTVKLMPAEDSGNRNYQGIAWYRKTFTLPKTNGLGGSFILHFEAIMGKQNIYVNGRLVKEHLGGYLPININLTEAGAKPGEECTVAVMADNSDDKSYPPGKTQMTLDFCYHGGIYRDVWLIERPELFITDAIDGEKQTGENGGKVASNGIFVHYANISEKSAEVYVNTTLYNSLSKPQTVTVKNILTDAEGKKIKEWTSKATIPAKSSKTIEQGSKISNPHLWSPETPYLYTLTCKVIGRGVKDMTLDGGSVKVGIRSFEFRGKDGFWLNGKRYRQFVGANRHQDFAYVGNAVPNSQQRRDVQRLKDAGFNIIRVAHYPQDPSFMDACDEFGIFVIVATPGWQFWNKAETFAERVHQNTRDIIRRDRNHPSVLMWEPILNETRYPENFSLEALQITRDEYPYPYRPVAAADLHSAGVLENYDVIYAWPGDDEQSALIDRSQRPGAISSTTTQNAEARCIELNKNMFTREFGEYVDDWYAHNNLNRASRSWGERPMLMQALTLSNTTADQHRTAGLFLGGCLWHPFDHQRGYHPDPYWGGIYDAFRQPKTAYYMFHSQIPFADNKEAFVHIANEMTQFSDNDVVVFSNCDSVRLSAFDGAESLTLPVKHEKVLTDMGEKDVKPFKEQMRNDAVAPYNAPVIFKDIWNFWKGRSLSYKPKNWQGVKLVADGYIDGKVACTDTVMPSRRSTKLRLYADERDRQLVADGSDFIVVVCEVTDDLGHVRRLAKDEIKFTVSGPAEIIGEGTEILANPRQVEWGSAPILLRSTREAGEISIHADVLFPGTHSPTPADLTIKSVSATMPFILSSKGDGVSNGSSVSSVSRDSSGSSAVKISDAEKQRMLKEVQDQQADFGTTK